MIHFESVPDSKLTRIYFPPQKSQFFVNSLFKYGKEDKLFSKTVGQANQIKYTNNCYYGTGTLLCRLCLL